MLRKWMMVSAVAFGLSMSGSVVAATKQVMQTPKKQPVQPMVMLYAMPSTSAKITLKLPPYTHLVPIFNNKKGWVKVGNPKDGTVGWVNIKQYHQARRQYLQPDIQTIYLDVEHDRTGKPTMSVVAYKNGQKLSQAQAEKLYKGLREKSMKEQRAMRHYFRDMNRMMDADMQQMQNMAPIILMPGPVILPAKGT